MTISFYYLKVLRVLDAEDNSIWKLAIESESFKKFRNDETTRLHREHWRKVVSF